MAAPGEAPTSRLGGDAWLLAGRALADRPGLAGVYVVLTAAMEWLQVNVGLDDGPRGMVLGDLLPSLVELSLVAALTIAVCRAVILEERQSSPPWRAMRTHLVLMGWLVASGVLWDAAGMLMDRAGDGPTGLLADAAVLLAGAILAMRLALLSPTIALTGSGGTAMLRGAWGMTRGHAAWMLLTFVITGAPMLGLAIVVAILGLPLAALPLPVALILLAAARGVVVALSASLASLFFIAYARHPASAHGN